MTFNTKIIDSKVLVQSLNFKIDRIGVLRTTEINILMVRVIPSTQYLTFFKQRFPLKNNNETNHKVNILFIFFKITQMFFEKRLKVSNHVYRCIKQFQVNKAALLHFITK